MVLRIRDVRIDEKEGVVEFFWVEDADVQLWRFSGLYSPTLDPFCFI